MRKRNGLIIGVAFFIVSIMIFSATATSIGNKKAGDSPKNGTIIYHITHDPHIHKIPPSNWADLQVLTENLYWPDVTPGDTVIGDIAIFGASWHGTVGWMITHWPEWGNWTFNPINGSFPVGETCHVAVTVVVPDEENATFGGYIRVQNTHNPDNYGDVYITLTTAKNLQVVGQNQQSGNLQVSQSLQGLIYQTPISKQLQNLQ